MIMAKTYSTESFKKLKSAGFVGAINKDDEMVIEFVGKPVLKINKGASSDARGSIGISDLQRCSKNEINHLLGRKKVLNITATKLNTIVAHVFRY